ncbi:MAG: type 2 isopentenyl-diphosphate Delta-isomerase [Euryarchaeota archaeon]|nr:type 2 isopentenyl-diphosphate Delta-isomerase [Euryarchaeota archaeon]
MVRQGSETKARKDEHIAVCLSEDVACEYNYWDDVRLVHNPLPELNWDEIDLRAQFLGCKLDAPLIISAITGGTEKGRKINENLAAAASELQIGMGVGSQRPALEDRSAASSFGVLRDYDVPFKLANLGAPQLIKQKGKRPVSKSDVRAAVEMIGANAVALHMNYLQEVAQPEGDLNSRGCLAAIKSLSSEFRIVAKETGAGMTRETALALRKSGVAAIDVGGMGGTSFSAVEHYRAFMHNSPRLAQIGLTFWDWGIPTPVAVQQAKVGVPLIATGGMRSGLDAARGIALGASLAGFAGRVLKPACESRKAVIDAVGTIIAELEAAMLLTSSQSVAHLMGKKTVIAGRTAQWLDQL